MGTPEYQWYLGDGAVSTERDPFHVYKMAGEYIVYRVRTTSEGEETDSLTIRVYDWYLNDRLHVAYTNKCFKAAVYPHQGVGIVERGGANWVWPEAWVGTCKGVDKANDHIHLVLDNASGMFYRIGIAEQWLDRLDLLSEYGRGGYEISSWFKLKEQVSSQGEFENIEHEESYVYMRPFNEENRDLDGYNSDTGMRDNFHVGAKWYLGGSQTREAEINRVPLRADYVAREKLQNPRIQLEVNFTAAGWRCIGVQNRVIELDKKQGPVYNTKSEVVWQREFLGQDLWISRDSTNPILDRTGLTISGSFDSSVTGPDNENNSGVFFNATTGLTTTLPSRERSTLIFWITDIVAANLNVFTFANGKRISLELDGSDYDLVINNGVQTVNIPLGYQGNEWTMIAIRFTVDGARVIRNNTNLGLHNIIMGEYGGATTIMNNVVGSLYDIRRVPADVSEQAISFYYRDIVSDRGNSFLPVMR